MTSVIAMASDYGAMIFGDLLLFYGSPIVALIVVSLAISEKIEAACWIGGVSAAFTSLYWLGAVQPLFTGYHNADRLIFFWCWFSVVLLLLGVIFRQQGKRSLASWMFCVPSCGFAFVALYALAR